MRTPLLALLVVLPCSACTESLSLDQIGLVGRAPRGWAVIPLDGNCVNVDHPKTRSGALVCRITDTKTMNPKTLEEEWAMVKPVYEPQDWTPETLPDGHVALYRPTTEGVGDEAGWRFESTRTIGGIEYSCDGWASDRDHADEGVAFCKSLRPR